VIEVNSAAVTVSVAEPLIDPEVAVMVELPCDTEVARPAPLIVATDVEEDSQETVLVRLWVVPLL
jgi:hypothetical protein